MTSCVPIEPSWQRQVKRRFDRAALTYGQWALAQQRSARHLACVVGQRAAGCVMADIGCGQGSLLAALTARPARLWAVDLSEGMLATMPAAIHQQPGLLRVCADVCQLPFADGSLAGVTSNFALHWAREPARVLASLYRVLAPAGWAVLAIPVRGSLPGRPASAVAGEALQSEPAWRQAAAAAGFRCERWQRLDYADYLPDADAWLQAVRAMGLTARAGAPSGLRGAAYLGQLRASLEAAREAAGIPLRYHVLQLELSKP